MAVVLLMCSSVNAINLIYDFKDCFDYADIQTNDTVCELFEITGHEAGYAEYHAIWLVFYENCAGIQ